MSPAQCSPLIERFGAFVQTGQVTGDYAHCASTGDLAIDALAFVVIGAVAAMLAHDFVSGETAEKVYEWETEDDE